MPATMTLLWTTLFLACTTSQGPFSDPPRDRSATFADPGLDQRGTSDVVQLWKVSGRFTLPETTLPEGFRLDDRLPVPVRRGKGDRWIGPSPFVETVRSRVGAPEGLELYAGSRALPYGRTPAPGTWMVRGDQIVVHWSDGTPPPISMAWDRARDALLRREPASSPDPATYARISLTIDGRTRPGLLLPAPAVAEFDVRLPEGARFEGWPAIAPAPFTMLASDGAHVSLHVVADGESTQVGRRFLKPGAAFSEWDVDLARWAGEAVTLRVVTEPHATRDFDHVFVGAPTVWGEAAGEVRRIVVVGLDTTRPDHFGFYGYDRPTTPEVDAWLESSAVFDHAWCPAPRTRPSFRAATTGRDPLDAVGAVNIGETFGDAGFATAGIVTNVHLQPRFDFDDGFDEWWFDARSTAEDQVDRGLAFLDRYPERDAYLFLHIMDPHLLYLPPKKLAAEFVTDPDPDLPATFNRWEVYRWAAAGDLDDRRKQHITDLYDAEIRATSIALGRFFDQLDRMPGRSLVVLHNDHGEEFWEHGAFEHNHTLYDEVTRAILAFRSGGGQRTGQRIPAPATLADIGPTLYDFAGIPAPPPTDGRSLAPLLTASEPALDDWVDRPIGVAHLRYGRQRWGVVLRGHKYILHTGSGQEELYDLAGDPLERTDLVRAGTADLAPYRTALAQAHDMPVGPGWRIRVDVGSKDRRPFVLTLPTRAISAGVIDPEATVETPANQAWGEVPQRRPEDVGSVQLSEDGRSLTFVPALPTAGKVRGTLFVLFDAPAAVEPLVMARPGSDAPLPQSRPGLWRSGPDGIQVLPGTVLVPPPSEVERIRDQQGATEDAGENRELLEALGYVEEEDEGGDDLP